MLQDKILNILENRNGALYKEAEKLKIEGYPEEGYLQLAVIRQLCIEEQYRQARKETKTKANPLAAIKKLTSMTSPHLVDLFRKVMPEAADKTDFSWCTDTHMLIFDKAEHMQGLSKGFYYHRELGTIPDVRKIIPSVDRESLIGCITKTELKNWRVRAREMGLKESEIRDVIPVFYDGKLLQAYRGKYLEIAMQYLGINKLVLYCNGDGYPCVIKKDEAIIVFTPILKESQPSWSADLTKKELFTLWEEFKKEGKKRYGKDF